MKVLGILIAILAGALCADTPKDTSFQRFGGVPVLAYAEETGWQLGVLGMVFLKPVGPKDPGGQVDFAVVGTTERQQRVVLNPVLALLGGDARLDFDVEYRNWPGKYWSGQNHPSDSSILYDMKYWQLEGNVVADLDQIHRNLKAGFEFNFETNTTRFLSPDSTEYAMHSEDYPDTSELPSKKGGNRIGLGWALQWDSRDHDNWPRKGLFAWTRQIYYSEWIGSDFNFINTIVDLRAFYPTPLGGAAGLAAYWEGLLGEAPFDRLAMPDGTYRMRGLSKGRLRDRQQAVLQMEWRVPMPWRFSMAAFVEAGKVGGYFSDLLKEETRYAIGAGPRFSLNPKRQVNVRADLAWVDGGLGMSVYYKEAF